MVVLGAAGEVAQRELPWAAWRGLKVPAEAVLEAAGIHARRVEAARRLGSPNPWRSSSPEFETGATGGAARRGGRDMRQQGEEWVQEGSWRLIGVLISGGSGGGAAPPALREGWKEGKEGRTGLQIAKSPGA